MIPNPFTLHSETRIEPSDLTCSTNEMCPYIGSAPACPGLNDRAECSVGVWVVVKPGLFIHCPPFPINGSKLTPTCFPRLKTYQVHCPQG